MSHLCDHHGDKQSTRVRLFAACCSKFETLEATFNHTAVVYLYIGVCTSMEYGRCMTHPAHPGRNADISTLCIVVSQQWYAKYRGKTLVGQSYDKTKTTLLSPANRQRSCSMLLNKRKPHTAPLVGILPTAVLILILLRRSINKMKTKPITPAGCDGDLRHVYSSTTWCSKAVRMC